MDHLSRDARNPAVLHAAESAAPASATELSADDRKLTIRPHAEAVKAVEAGRWEVAIVEFTAAYQLSYEPVFLHNLSLTLENQGETAEASR